jgi:GNAT superfamily N-acetyltransferase
MYGTSKEKFPGENQLYPTSKVIVLYDDKTPVACGAFKIANDGQAAELKRMFVLQAWRGKGLSRLLLSELEKWATEQGYYTIRLKTGHKQQAAIALYLRSGYNSIPPYGGYVNIPDSVCLEKKFAQGNG